MNRFYISDLDKTILDDNAKLTLEAKDKINTIIKKNIKFTIATARSYNSVKHIFKGIDLQYPIIELNGTMLTDYNTEKHHLINFVDYEIIEDITKYAEKHSMYPFYTVIDIDTKICNLYPPLFINKGSQWFIDDRYKNKDSRLMKSSNKLEKIKNKKFLSMTFIYKYDEVFKLKEFLENSSFRKDISIDFFDNPYSKDWQWLTVLSNKSQKGIAINKLKKVLNIENHEIIVFGDNLNDINMFKIADRAYAVKNAKQELKDISTAVIDYNHKNSVLDFILNENK